MIRGIWDRETAALVLLAAALPVAVTWLHASGAAGAVRLVFVLVVAGLWHLVFMVARAQPPSFAGALTALLIAMLAQTGLGPGQLLLGISFGVVIAELAFGGWGRNVLNPATVTLAFLGFGFPAAPWPDLPVQLGWAAAAAGLIGVIFGVMPWRILAGALAVWAIGWAVGAPLHGPDLTAAAVVLVLIVADPVSSAATPAGRWLNGGLYGLLALIFAAAWASAAPVQLAVSAALLASLTAPLLDEIALSVWLAMRDKRLGRKRLG